MNFILTIFISLFFVVSANAQTQPNIFRSIVPCENCLTATMLDDGMVRLTATQNNIVINKVTGNRNNCFATTQSVVFIHSIYVISSRDFNMTLDRFIEELRKTPEGRNYFFPVRLNYGQQVVAHFVCNTNAVLLEVVAETNHGTIRFNWNPR